MYTFEDFVPGHFIRLGPRRVTRDEIIAFATEFDPQPMHLDEEAAKHSLLGGLSGSGWHMCALSMRMQVDGFMRNSTSLGGLGISECRWLAPLRPDDLITLEVYVESTRLSQSRPGTGIVVMRTDMFNARGEMLMQLFLSALFARGAAAAK